MNRPYLAGIISVLLVLVGFGVYRATKREATGLFEEVAAQLPEEIRLGKAEGLSMEPDDLRPKPPIPAAANAAPLIRNAINEAANIRQGGYGSLEKPLQNAVAEPTSTNLAIAKAHLTKIAPVLKILKEASARAKCDFDRPWEDGPVVLFPELARMKAFTKALTFKAQLAANAGRIDEAVGDLWTAHKIGLHAGAEPTLIGMLVMIACEGIVLRAVEVVSSNEAANRGVLTKLASLVRRMDSRYDFNRALAGEVVMGRISARLDPSMMAALSSGGTGASAAPFPQMANKKLQAQAFETRVIQVWRRAFAEFKSRKMDPQAMGEYLDDVARGEQEAMYLDPTRIINAIVFPVFSQAGAALVRMDANRKVVGAKIDVLLFRLKHGRYPKSLKEVGPMPLDPFVQKPLQYRVIGNGFRVYSLGTNKLDDGGIGPGSTGAPTDEDAWQKVDVVSEHPLDPKKRPKPVTSP